MVSLDRMGLAGLIFDENHQQRPSAVARGVATLTALVVSSGRQFLAILVNRMGPLDLHLVAAEVYKTPSWLDNNECIVLHYSKTSLVAHWIRDEIRLISPNFCLGKVYWDMKRLIDFSLKF
jgi:hypothetical protein